MTITHDNKIQVEFELNMGTTSYGNNMQVYECRLIGYNCLWNSGKP